MHPEALADGMPELTLIYSLCSPPLDSCLFSCIRDSRACSDTVKNIVVVRVPYVCSFVSFCKYVILLLDLASSDILVLDLIVSGS